MRPQLGSRAALVIDTLVTLCRNPLEVGGEYDLAGVDVLDGPPLASGSSLADDVISVAPGEADNPGAVVTRTPQSSLGRQSYLESVEVAVVCSSYSGDTDMGKRRARCVELFDALKRRIDAHQVYPGVWDQVRLGDSEEWTPVQSENGCVVYVGFTVVASAIL